MSDLKSCAKKFYKRDDLAFRLILITKILYVWVPIIRRLKKKNGEGENNVYYLIFLRLNGNKDKEYDYAL